MVRLLSNSANAACPPQVRARDDRGAKRFIADSSRASLKAKRIRDPPVDIRDPYKSSVRAGETALRGRGSTPRRLCRGCLSPEKTRKE